MEKRYNAKLNNVVKGIDTYWLSLPLQTAFNHKHSLFVEGGSENLRFGVDLSYYNEDGVMKESFRDRLGAGVTLDYHLKNLQVKNQTTYNITKSKEIFYELFDIMKALFIEVNPIPIKEAMNILGFQVGPTRLPLCAMESKHKKILKKCLEK